MHSTSTGISAFFFFLISIFEIGGPMLPPRSCERKLVAVRLNPPAFPSGTPDSQRSTVHFCKSGEVGGSRVLVINPEET